MVRVHPDTVDAMDGRSRGRTALVLGGGGVTGIAWEAGVLAGLAESGVDLVGSADVIVGTSAGAVVGARLATGTAVRDLYAEQFDDPATVITARFGPSVGIRMLAYQLLPGLRSTRRARLGRAALKAGRRADSEEVARIIASLRLPAQWPRRELLVTAVDAETGQLRVFNAASGVPLSDAVAASCAVPLVWPPVTVDGHPYIDGGIRSPTNADLAVAATSVVVLAPIPQALSKAGRVSTQVRRLGPQVDTTVVRPDKAALAAFGRDVLDQSRAAPSAQAGFAQGQRLLTGEWSGAG